jgi:dihydrofolate reductase
MDTGSRGDGFASLAITQNVTVDDAIEMLGDWFDPRGQADVDNSDLLEELHRQDSQADGFLVGRRTFEDLRGYWRQLSDDPTGISDYLNGVQKYVVSSTITDPQWQNSTVLPGDPIEEVRAFKEQSGQDIVVTGSITLCHTLVGAGLVDEYRLFVYPVVQGRGRRLFPKGFECPKLRLAKPRPFEAASRLALRPFLTSTRSGPGSRTGERWAPHPIRPRSRRSSRYPVTCWA